MNYAGITINLPKEEEKIFIAKKKEIDKLSISNKLTPKMIVEWQKYLQYIGEKYLK